MTPLTTIHAAAAPRPGGSYSHAIRAGGLLLLAGQVGVDPADGRLPDGVAAQTRQALRNLEAVLRAAGGSLDRLAKTTCFLASLDDFAAFDAAYREVLGDHRPARSTVGVELAGGCRVEIEGIALLDG